MSFLRAAKMHSRRQISKISDLEDLLAKEKLSSIKWRDKFNKKVVSHNKVSQNYKNKIQSLCRRLNYVEDLLNNIKQKVGQLKSQNHKNLVNEILLSTNECIKAPSKNYNLVNKYYKKK